MGLSNNIAVLFGSQIQHSHKRTHILLTIISFERKVNFAAINIVKISYIDFCCPRFLLVTCHLPGLRRPKINGPRLKQACAVLWPLVTSSRQRRRTWLSFSDSQLGKKREDVLVVKSGHPSDASTTQNLRVSGCSLIDFPRKTLGIPV